MNEHPGIGIVVIGRNEGERLIACLHSLGTLVQTSIYVDSGSSDGSVAAAQSLGAKTIVLAPDMPFTAARARNAGRRALATHFPDLEFIQFIDGDCILDADWIGKAARFLRAQPDIAIVGGRRREQFPEHSIYNRLCDAEWNTPIGEARECGGDILVRSAAFDAAGGYSDDLIAGEEPELCVRLRQAGWRIWRLDAEMTMHDANITRFRQYWRRAQRGGHAFAEISRRHAGSPFGIWGRQTKSVLLWGLVLPAIIVLLALIHPAALVLLLIYPLQVARLGIRYRGEGRFGWARAFFLVLGKFPEMLGALQYFANAGLKRHTRLIEYK